MSKNSSFRLILTGAMVAAAAFTAPRAFTPVAHFDSALETSGVWCNPANRMRPMASHVKAAQAKAEAGPFHNRIDTGRPLPDDTGDVQRWNDPGDHHLRVTTLEPERL